MPFAYRGSQYLLIIAWFPLVNFIFVSERIISKEIPYKMRNLNRVKCLKVHSKIIEYRKLVN